MQQLKPDNLMIKSIMIKYHDKSYHVIQELEDGTENILAGNIPTLKEAELIYYEWYFEMKDNE